MPISTDNVTEFVEPVPLLPVDEVFHCWITRSWHPAYYLEERARHMQNAQGRYQWTYYPVVVDPRRWLRDLVGDEHEVHKRHADDSCSWCSELVLYREMNHEADTYYRRFLVVLCNECADSASSCQNCGCPYPEDNGYTVAGSHWCEGCYDSYATECDDCGSMYNNDNHDECPDCAGARILPYSTKFSPLMFHFISEQGRLEAVRSSLLPDELRNEVFLGLEFEQENSLGLFRTGDIADVYSPMIDKDQIMLKHDGSLSDGFELVSQPHTLEALMREFDWDLVRKAQADGMRGWDVGSREVGVHIHISRKAFHTKPDHTRYNCSPHLHAFMHFVYSNIGSIKRIAGRNVHYGHMSERYLERAFAIARYGHNQDSRTQAINLMNNDTVELRMFRSTMRVERLQAYLQFADASVRYTATNRVEKMRDRFHFTDFAKWVEVQPRYKQLSDLIVEVDAVAHAPARPNIIDVNNAEHDNDDEFVPCQSDDRF